jgi:WD40 repeat protein
LVYLSAKKCWISGNKLGLIEVWIQDKKEPLILIQAHKGNIYGLAIGQENTLLSVSQDKQYKLWNMSDLTPIRLEIPSALRSINTLLPTPTGYAVAGDNGKVIVLKFVF